MRIIELLTEWSTQDKRVSQQLIKMGYEPLGRPGVDCAAYLEPGTGEVLKIFGTNEAASVSGWSADQLMFNKWAKISKANQHSPYFPRFSGWESFDFQGKKYLQIRMERLQSLPPGLGVLLENIASLCEHGKSTVDIVDHYRNTIGMKTGIDYQKLEFSKNKLIVPPRIFSDRDDALVELIMQIGEEEFTNLVRSIWSVVSMGRQYGYVQDLHSGNFMHRNDGIPVIVDPWVVDKW